LSEKRDFDSPGGGVTWQLSNIAVKSRGSDVLHVTPGNQGYDFLFNGGGLSDFGKQKSIINTIIQ